MTTERMLRRREVENLCGLHASTIYRLMSLDQFPQPVRIGLKAVRWPESELKAWLAKRPHVKPDIKAA